MNNETVKLPEAAIDAWVDYDPPEFKHTSTALRHAFMAGFLAGNEPVEGLESRVEALEHALQYPDD